ncbi:MAG TPA: hypothetical protein VMH87_13535 [Pseudomonadales bacterium]|nr:hypothetical protein [Pseudomonadales bacterium]
MANSIPFSITPEAEDFLREIIKEIPRGKQPVLMMATEQSDGLNPPRWFYKGESFIIGCYGPAERPKAECIELKLAGHNVAVESSALEHLSGQRLALRRVDAHYGLMRGTRYVMVTDSTSGSPDHPFNEEGFIERITRGFPIGALTILGGFTGMGVVWIASAMLIQLMGIQYDKLALLIEYLLVPGWILGAIASFFFFRSVYKTNGQTKFAREQRGKNFLGSRGLEGQMDWWVFLGIPASLMAILIWVLLPFAHTDTQKGYGTVILLMIVLGGGMFFCDKMPRKWIFWLGLLGWVLAFIFFFKLQAAGSDWRS